MTYLRYIDNIFFIWKRTNAELKSFLEIVSHKHSSIKFDYKYIKSKVELLDTFISKDEIKTLQTTISRKSTARQSYLRATSRHPAFFKNSIPYSQMLRIKRICSTITEFKQNRDTLG